MKGLVCVMLWLAVGVLAWGQAVKPLLDCNSAKAFARVFREKTGEWTTSGQGITGKSPRYRDLPGTKLDGFADDAHTFFVVHSVNLWRYATAGEANWTDYTLETTVHIDDPAPLNGIRPGQDNVFMNYQWGREAMGSDAGLLVRYQGPDCYYMVRLSSGYGHVELWKTKGGVVCVKPYVFAPGKDYRLTVTAAGRWITVAVDGTEVLRYYDPVEPILSGKIALGVRESQVRFANLRVTPAVAPAAAAPVHSPAFHFRNWVGRNYIFDGDEPIAHIAKQGASIQEMKLTPGLMPMMINQPGASWGTDWKDDVRLIVRKEGATLAFDVEQDDKNGNCAGVNNWTLNYDPAVGYIWDVREKVTALVDGKCKWGFDLADPCFYQTVAPATDKMPTGRTHPNYALYTRVDGKYGCFPTNHRYKNGNAQTKDLSIRKGGFFATTVDDWAAAVELPDDNVYQYFADYCFWGLDQHVEHVAVTNTPAKKGDFYYGHARFYPLPPARVQQIIAEGVLPADRPENHTELVAHVEPVNHCTDIVQAVAGDSKVRWHGEYTIDRTVGHGDKQSMRITPKVSKGPGEAEVTTDEIGPSYRTGPYLARQYRFGCWVKADQFTGKVALSADRIVYPVKRDAKNTQAALDIKDKCEWIYVSFVADFPRYAHFWTMHLNVQGTGTVWVDDIEISPLD